MYTPNSKVAVARYDLGREARKRGIEGQVTTILELGVQYVAHQNWHSAFVSFKGGTDLLGKKVNRK